MPLYNQIIIIIIIIFNISSSSSSAKPQLYYAHDIRTGNQHQIRVPENWYQNLAPAFGTGCKISGNSNKNGR